MTSLVACTGLLFLLNCATQSVNGDRVHRQLREHLKSFKAEIENKYDAKLLALEKKFEDEIAQLKRDFTEREKAYRTVIEELQREINGDGREFDDADKGPPLVKHSNDEEETPDEEQSDKIYPSGETVADNSETRKRQPNINGVKVGKRQFGEHRVAFFASLTDTQTHMGQNQDIPFDKILTNIGSAFNGRHGTFVAPVAGTYVLATTALGFNDWCHFMVNGNIVAKLTLNNDQSSQMVIVHLDRGDDVSIQSTALDKSITGDRYSTFCGFLLYEDDMETGGSIIG